MYSACCLSSEVKHEQGQQKQKEADDPKFKLHAITGLSRWTKEAAVRITEKKKKKLTLKGYSKACYWD